MNSVLVLSVSLTYMLSKVSSVEGLLVVLWWKLTMERMAVRLKRFSSDVSSKLRTKYSKDLSTGLIVFLSASWPLKVHPK